MNHHPAVTRWFLEAPAGDESTDLVIPDPPPVPHPRRWRDEANAGIGDLFLIEKGVPDQVGDDKWRWF